MCIGSSGKRHGEIPRSLSLEIQPWDPTLNDEPDLRRLGPRLGTREARAASGWARAGAAGEAWLFNGASRSQRAGQICAVGALA